MNNLILPSILDNDTLTSSEVSAIITKLRNDKEIKKKYEDKIKQRKDGRQYYVLINRKQISATTLNGLYEKLYEWEYGRQHSTLEMLFKEWLIWKRDYTSVTSKTLREYIVYWNKYLLKSDIAHIALINLTVKDFLLFFRKITKNRTLTRKEFTNLKSLLNGVYTYAIEEELVTHNPIRDVNCRQLSFKPVNNKHAVFTIKERDKLINYLKTKNDIYSLSIQLDFQLVIRIGELRALRWSDIDGDSIRIQMQNILDNDMNDDFTFTTKKYINVDHMKGYADKGFRTEPLSEEAKRILQEIRLLNPDGEFILMNDNKQLSTDTFNTHLKRYCKEAGVTPYSSHKIRFFVASVLYLNGVPLTKLQELLGHTTLEMTIHYLRSVTREDNTGDIMNQALLA